MIDWPSVLREQGISFVDKGPSTSKGNIYVHCVLCGASDTGHHLGISIRSPWRGYGCWRNNQHRGRNPVKLLSLLLNISTQRAEAILGVKGPVLLEDDDVKGKLAALLSPKEELSFKEERRLNFPPEIKSLQHTNGTHMKDIFIEYLIERGYSYEDTLILTKNYQLRYARTGLFKYRVIFPVYTMVGLTTWTGRTIVPDKEPRYLSLTSNPDVANGGPLAKANIKDCLFNERWLYSQEGKALIVAEGPFDAMRLDYVGRKYDVHATGLFGKTISDAQLSKLEEIGQGYKHKFILLDPDAEFDRLAIYERIKSLAFRTIKLYDGPWTDPGSAPLKVLKEFIQKEILY